MAALLYIELAFQLSCVRNLITIVSLVRYNSLKLTIRSLCLGNLQDVDWIHRRFSLQYGNGSLCRNRIFSWVEMFKNACVMPLEVDEQKATMTVSIFSRLQQLVYSLHVWSRWMKPFRWIPTETLGRTTEVIPCYEATFEQSKGKAKENNVIDLFLQGNEIISEVFSRTQLNLRLPLA